MVAARTGTGGQAPAVTAARLLVVLCAFPVGISAQEPFLLSRLDGPVEVDGILDEPPWQSIQPLPLTMHTPTYGGELSERTEVRIGYDDEYLYVAGHLYDSDPSGIRENSLYRDRWSGDDTFGFILDTFNDNENGLWFFTNPAGVRFDMTITADATSGSFGTRPFESSWNTYWDVAVTRSDEGWFAEFRIPYSSLGFQDLDGRVEMGLIVSRYISRRSERQLFPAILPNWAYAYAKPSQAHTVVLEGVSSGKPVYVTPYALGGLGQETELPEGAGRYDLKSDTEQELGLDIKYNLRDNLTLDVTVNTDFAQVEADDQQVNLTRFSLFFPEKRQFFQERAGTFDFRTGMVDRLFHSRQIGLHEGKQVRLLGGGRLVGRLGGWDVGLMDLQTGESDGLSSENFGVLRLRRQLFNPFSYAGTMVTSRLGADGSYNVVYAVDGILRLTGDEYLTVQWAQSFDDDVADATGFDFGRAALFRAHWERRTQQGLFYQAQVNYLGGDFTPGMGFVQRSDVTQVETRLGYGWLPGEGSPFRTITPNFASAGLWFRNGDGSLESASFGSWFNYELKNGGQGWVGFEGNIEDLREPLPLPEDVEVPLGRYEFWTLNTSYNHSRSSLFSFNTKLEAGAFYDGWRVNFSLTPIWNVSRNLELGADYQIAWATFPDRNQAFTVHVPRIRIQAALDTKLSASAFVQYNSAADLVTPNVRIRYNFREGNDLWLVYNEGMNTDRDVADPRLPLTDTRTVLLKYTYTFGS